MPDCPSCSHANGEPSGGIHQAWQALAVCQNHPENGERSLDAGSRFHHELIRRVSQKSVLKKSKVNKMDTTRFNATSSPESGHDSGGGRSTGGRLLLSVANRSGLRDSRRPITNLNGSRVSNNPGETGHFPKYPSQNGTSSSCRPCSAGSGARSR